MRPDIRERKAAEKAFSEKHGGKPISLADIDLSFCPTWPRCDEKGCNAPALTVATWPGNWIHGVFDEDKDDTPEALFACPEHPDALQGWYWMDIGFKDRKNADVHVWFWSREFLTHIAEKDWGPRFVAWLLENYDLSEHAEANALRAWRELS